MGTPWQVRAKPCAISLALLVSIASLNEGISRARAQGTYGSCVDPAGLARSVVSITRYFDEPRHNAAGIEIIGERATAWFYTSPRVLVTAAHFASELPVQGWQEVELRQASGEGDPDTSLRVQLRVAGQRKAPQGQVGASGRGTSLAEDVAILELRDPFPNAQVLDIELEPPTADATVLVLGYPGGRMQAVRGIVRESRDPAGRFAGLSLIEVQGSDRLLLNSGTSGAPVLDCRRGLVVAVLNGLLTGPTLPFLPPGHSVIPTAWGCPTNTAVPASALTDVRDWTTMSPK